VEPRDITNEILIGIRDEIRQTNTRLDGHERILIRVADALGVLTGRVDVLTDHVDVLTGRVDVLGGQMEQANARLERHDGRFARMTEILTSMDHRLTSMDHRLERVEGAIDVTANPVFVDLQRRVEALEHKAG